MFAVTPAEVLEGMTGCLDRFVVELLAVETSQLRETMCGDGLDRNVSPLSMLWNVTKNSTVRLAPSSGRS